MSRVHLLRDRHQQLLFSVYRPPWKDIRQCENLLFRRGFIRCLTCKKGRAWPLRAQLASDNHWWLYAATTGSYLRTCLTKVSASLKNFCSGASVKASALVGVLRAALLGLVCVDPAGEGGRPRRTKWRNRPPRKFPWNAQERHQCQKTCRGLGTNW